VTIFFHFHFFPCFFLVFFSFPFNFGGRAETIVFVKSLSATEINKRKKKKKRGKRKKGEKRGDKFKKKLINKLKRKQIHAARSSPNLAPPRKEKRRERDKGN